MNQTGADNLYHQLRQLSVGDDSKMKNGILHLTRYLLESESYLDLLHYESAYGSQYLFPTVRTIASCFEPFPHRVVDLGCGLGWLGDMLTASLNLPRPGLFIDKRQWLSSITVYDLEKEGPNRLFKEYVKLTDLVVMSELFHCLDNETQVNLIHCLKPHSFIIVEYGSRYPDYLASYDAQCSLKGCGQMTAGFMNSILESEVPGCKSMNSGPWTIFYHERSR